MIFGKLGFYFFFWGENFKALRGLFFYIESVFIIVDSRKDVRLFVFFYDLLGFGVREYSGR